MELEFYQYVIAIVGGAFAGALNTLAGSGSAITLTILTEIIGLPPNMANGTNRIGICAQCAAGSWSFYKNGILKPSQSINIIIPAVLGAIVGVLVAVWVSNEQFKTVFSYLMVFMLFVILVKPKRWLRKTDLSQPKSPWIMIPAFFALGFYGGFIQMGMGVFFLATMVLLGKYSMTDGNAIKSFVVFIYTILVIAIFQWKGLIDWRIGGIMAIGQTAGGWYTAEFASKYKSADLWAYRLLVIVVVFAILKLFNITSYFGL